MAEFKPMVKMYTDEPSVILKLKKGGKVKAAKHEEHGHKPMHHEVAKHMKDAHEVFESEHGKSPKKPSMAERRKAMNPNLYKKGGKVEHKQLGGMTGVAPAVNPLSRAALMGMTPMQRAARAALVRKALTGMKKGGSADHKMVEKLEKELHHHESMPASKAHPEHKKHGGKMVRKADGGEIDSAETKTTLKNSPKEFSKTKMDTADRHDGAHGTGEVREGAPAGYKKGGKAKKMCKGGRYAQGGTIEGNEGEYENTKMDTAHEDKAHGTGGVRMSNDGGYKKGGRARKEHEKHRYAKGGNVREPGLLSTTIEGGDWENRPANTAKPGVKATKSGEVKEANAGGYKRGGHAKKHYATGGNVVDDGKAVKMPKRIAYPAVANSLQSGTYKRGGKVKKYAEGDGVYQDPQTARENQGYNKAVTEPMDPVGEAINGALSDVGSAVMNKMKGAYNTAKDYLTGAPGSVTKTVKSTTVVPQKRRGGRAC